VMLVSHDRALLREVCDEFWLVTKGAIEPFDGDLDDYQRWLLEQAKAAAKAAREEASAPRGAATANSDRAASPDAGAPAAAAAAAGGSREERKAAALARQQRSDAAKPLRQELNRIDNKLGVLFAERDALEASLAAPDVDTARLAETGRRLKEIVEQIEKLEARWLELSTQLDEIAESVG